MYNRLLKCLEYIRTRTEVVPTVGIVLGSGLGALAEEVEDSVSVPYSDIPGFPVSTVAGHAGRFVFGTLQGIPVAVMQGRVHYYEGYTMAEVVLPIRLMCLMGARGLLLTNAAGGLNTSFQAGDLMQIRDHITSFVPSPLIGENIDELGVRFPDMTEVYSKRLFAAVRAAAVAENINLREGVYVQTTGPQYETPTEVKMYAALGADAVGMSTTVEAIAAHHMGAEVAGISCIANMGTGITGQPLTHEEVGLMGRRTAPVFKRLVRAAVVEIASSLH